MTRLTPQQVQSFADHGFCVVPGLVHGAQLAALADRLDQGALGKLTVRVQTEPALRDDPQREADPINRVRKLERLAVSDGFFRDFVAEQQFITLAEQLLGSPLRFFGDEAQLKPARNGSAHPWHQDQPYYVGIDRPFVTFWIAVDAATIENGCMQVIPGSHHRGVLPRPDTRRAWFLDGELDVSSAVPCQLEPGDVLLFHAMLLHGSGPNRTDRRRRSMIFRYINVAGMDDAAWTLINRTCDVKDPAGREIFQPRTLIANSHAH